MISAPDAEALVERMRTLDQQLATIQAEQAALWAAMRRAFGAPSTGLPAIIDAVSAEFRVPRREILSDRRNGAAVAARHAACWLARQLTSLSYPAIARQMGRDHTTIMHSVNAAELRIGRDGEFAQQLATLQAELAPRIASPQPQQEAA